LIETLERARPTSVNNLICAAIERRVLLSARYRLGEPRVLEPYGHGTNSRGIETLLAFQRAGESRTGESEGWKAFVVGDLSDVVLLDVLFLPTRNDYVPGQSYNLTEVHCYIAP
jgi:hypothetical protein